MSVNVEGVILHFSTGKVVETLSTNETEAEPGPYDELTQFINVKILGAR